MSGEAQASWLRGVGSRLLWVAIGVVLASGAIAAAVNSGEQADASDRAPLSAEDVDAAAPSVLSHRFPAEHEGPVWIVVTAADAERREVTVRWGPWARPIEHQGEGPTVYAFHKGRTEPGEEVVPVTVTVAAGATIEFGSGPEAPAGAIDVNEDWVPVD